jgi:hypothetical protein
MSEQAKPDQDDDAAQNTEDKEDTARGDGSEEAEAPEVVAHCDDGAELPWCIGYT